MRPSLFLLFFVFKVAYSSEVLEKKGLTWVNLQVSHGEIAVTNSERDTTVLTIDKSKAGPDCKLEIQQLDSEFVIDGLQTAGQMEDSCFFSFILQAPIDVFPSIMFGNGSLKSTGSFKQLRFTTGKGNIELTGDINDLELGAKEVTAKLHGTFNKALIDFTKGAARVQISSVSQLGKINLSGKEMDWEVVLPNRSSAKGTYRNGSGSSVYKFKSGFELSVQTLSSQSIKVEN